ncbi:hypothetical protein HBB16_09350 [Pseudonocardia sp. MCCB 268]|nr:hypothetical protein [Pseudonocardia cytotoxica]
MRSRRGPRRRPRSFAPAAGLDATAVRRVWSWRSRPRCGSAAAAPRRCWSTPPCGRSTWGDTSSWLSRLPLARRLEQRNTDVISEALRAVLGVR